MREKNVDIWIYTKDQSFLQFTSLIYFTQTATSEVKTNFKGQFSIKACGISQISTSTLQQIPRCYAERYPPSLFTYMAAYQIVYLQWHLAIHIIYLRA